MAGPLQRCRLAALFLLAGTGSASAAPPEPKAPPADVSTVKDKLIALHDGKKHVLVVEPFAASWDHAYWGDGKTFHALRIGSSSASGNESWSFTFWEPRVAARYQASVSFKAGTYELECDGRKTRFEPLPEAESRAMIAAAAFFQPRWRFRAYALARDDRGTYYYVDRQREPEDSMFFRLFVGPRGKLKPLPMTNVVSDSEGDIFATRSGELRLILDKRESTWVKGKARTTLVSLPVEDNVKLIYGDLGVYTGQRLGTPCDDL